MEKPLIFLNSKEFWNVLEYWIQGLKFFPIVVYEDRLTIVYKFISYFLLGGNILTIFGLKKDDSVLGSTLD